MCIVYNFCLIFFLYASLRPLLPYRARSNSLPLKCNWRSFFTNWTLNTVRTKACVRACHRIYFPFGSFLFSLPFKKKVFWHSLADFVCELIFFICKMFLVASWDATPVDLFPTVRCPFPPHSSFTRSLVWYCCMCLHYVALFYFYFFLWIYVYYVNDTETGATALALAFSQSFAQCSIRKVKEKRLQSSHTSINIKISQFDTENECVFAVRSYCVKSNDFYSCFFSSFKMSYIRFYKFSAYTRLISKLMAIIIFAVVCRHEWTIPHDTHMMINVSVCTFVHSFVPFPSSVDFICLNFRWHFQTTKKKQRTKIELANTHVSDGSKETRIKTVPK